MKRQLVIAALAFSLCGCSTIFRETHYFKSETPKAAQAPNYYRLTVEGNTLFSSARYISGYFDEESINAYFNEFSQPSGGAILPPGPRPDPSSGGAGGRTGGAGEVQPIAKGLKGRNLILILSSNSDDVANQIGALATNKQFTASLAGLFARDQYDLAEDAKHALAADRARAKLVVDLGGGLVATLPEGASGAEATARLLQFANQLASSLGYEGSFSSLDDAARWLEFSRSRLLRGER